MGRGSFSGPLGSHTCDPTMHGSGKIMGLSSYLLDWAGIGATVSLLSGGPGAVDLWCQLPQVGRQRLGTHLSVFLGGRPPAGGQLYPSVRVSEDTYQGICGISGWSWLHPWWRRLVGPGGCGKGQGTVAQPGLGAGRRAGPCCWHVQWKLPFPADGKLRVAGGCPRAPAIRGVRPPTHTSVTSQLRAWQCSARRGTSPPNTGLQVLSGARSGHL